MGAGTVSSAERMLLDHICSIPVCVEPVEPLQQRDASSNITEVAVRLRIVSAEGRSFTVNDLPKMCLSRDTVHELEGLCRRRIIGMSRKYLPRGADHFALVSETCKIGEYSRVEVVFSIKGTLLKHKHHVEHH